MSFARVANGREHWSAGAAIARHRHDAGYAAIVLAGSYEECGTRGRFCVGPGDVLLHSAFDAHLDRFARAGADILNLALRDFDFVGASVARVADPDAVARCAESDPEEAALRLTDALVGAMPGPSDWPDLLAAALIDDPSLCLGGWAYTHGLAAETLSRGFKRVFGISPAAFRAEARACSAFSDIVATDAPLAAIAHTRGFADQAHMTRATRSLTGAPPSYWRTSNRFKTAQARPA